MTECRGQPPLAGDHGRRHRAADSLRRAPGGGEHHGPMPAPSPNPADYYRRVAPVLLRHLAGRPIVGLSLVGSAGPEHTVPLPTTPATADDLAALVAGGILGFGTAPTDRIALYLTPGDGADIATAATAALHLAERCAAEGLRAVPLTDGADGLYVLARTEADPYPCAARFASALTASAPELATTDPAQADGRCLLRVQPGFVPVVYTLVPGRDGGAAIPLHLDEIAAITAGMPADLTAADVPDRLAARGDLAATLLGPPAGWAEAGRVG